MAEDAQQEQKICPIVFCADENYGKYLPAAAQSLLENASADNVYHIIVFDCGADKDSLSALKRQIAEYKNFSLSIKPIKAYLRAHEQAFEEKWTLTKSMYGRLFIPELCGDYKTVIYADIDVIFNRDIAPLAQLNLGDYYLAGVKDLSGDIDRLFNPPRKAEIEGVLGLGDGDFYVNSGLLVFNAEAWRQHRLADKAIALLTERRLHLPDQDAINAVCKGKIYYLDYSWNCLNLTDYFTAFAEPIKLAKNTYLNGEIEKMRQAAAKEECVFHYTTAPKPWDGGRCENSCLWWKYAAKTMLYPHYIANLVAKRAEDIIRPLQNRLSQTERPMTRIYKFLGVPFWQVKKTHSGKIYGIGKLRLAKQKTGSENCYLYILGIKLFELKRR